MSKDGLERGTRADDFVEVVLNFDFILENQTDSELVLKFVKVAVYDKRDNLVTYRYLNHNGVGTPGIHSLGDYEKALDNFLSALFCSRNIASLFAHLADLSVTLQLHS